MLTSSKVLVFLLLTSYLTKAQREPTAEEKKRQYSSRFGGVECKNFDNSTAYITKCSIKAYRNFTALNFAYVIVKSLRRPVYIQAIAQYRYGNIFRDILNSHKRDFCDFLSNMDVNPVLKMILQGYLNSIPNFPKKCPISEGAEFSNMTINNADATVNNIWYPEGNYKYIIKIFKSDKQPLIEIIYKVNVKSPIKESFG